MQNFSLLASKLREEFGVTLRQTTFFPLLTPFSANRIDFSNPLARSWRKNKFLNWKNKELWNSSMAFLKLQNFLSYETFFVYIYQVKSNFRHDSITCLTPLLGGLQVQLFQGASVWQNILASSPNSTTNLRLSESVFLTTLCSIKSLLSLFNSGY